jgi:hypothetical protein
MRELSERPNGDDAERAYRRLKGPALLKARRWFATLTRPTSRTSTSRPGCLFASGRSSLEVGRDRPIPPLSQ